MKKTIIIIFSLIFSLTIFSQPTLVVNSGKSYKIEPDVSKTGLDLGCFVVQNEVPLSFVFTSDSNESMTLYSFGVYGSTQKELIAGAVQQGRSLT